MFVQIVRISSAEDDLEIGILLAVKPDYALDLFDRAVDNPGEDGTFGVVADQREILLHVN